MLLYNERNYLPTHIRSNSSPINSSTPQDNMVTSQVRIPLPSQGSKVLALEF